MSQDSEELKDLRKSLKIEEGRPSLVQLLDEALEIMQSLEKRLRTIERMYEEND